MVYLVLPRGFELRLQTIGVRERGGILSKKAYSQRKVFTDTRIPTTSIPARTAASSR